MSLPLYSGGRRLGLLKNDFDSAVFAWGKANIRTELPCPWP